MSGIFSTETQYNDLKGKISIDNGDTSNIFDLLTNNGINTNIYFPIGVTYYQGVSHSSLRITTIDKSNTNLSDYDSIKDYIDSQDVVPVKVFDIKISLEDFIKNYTKRFSFAMSNIEGFVGKEITEI